MTFRIHRRMALDVMRRVALAVCQGLSYSTEYNQSIYSLRKLLSVISVLRTDCIFFRLWFCAGELLFFFVIIFTLKGEHIVIPKWKMKMTTFLFIRITVWFYIHYFMFDYIFVTPKWHHSLHILFLNWYRLRSSMQSYYVFVVLFTQKTLCILQIHFLQFIWVSVIGCDSSRLMLPTNNTTMKVPIQWASSQQRIKSNEMKNHQKMCSLTNME